MKNKVLITFMASCVMTAITVRAAEPESRPNIIFILCDDLGYGDVGVFYQNERAAKNDRSVPFLSTPQIDTMARDGVKMVQHYCGAPVCASSRSSLLTGLTQGHAAVRNNEFDKALPDSHTMGTVLKQAGYATAAFGKWGLQGGDWKTKKNKHPRINRPLSEKAAEYATWDGYPTKRGFDYFFGYVRHVDGHSHYPKEDRREVWENDREVSSELDKCYTADLWTAQAKKWITEQAASQAKQPFFAYLAYDTPHSSLQNPPCPYPEGGGLEGGVQWTGKPHAMLNTATGTVDGYMFPEYAQATWDDDSNPDTAEVPWPEGQKRYANDVRRIDFAVGDLLQLLKDLKIDDNTLVVFTSDNGPSSGSNMKNVDFDPRFFQGYGPFNGIKRDTLEGGLREPTLVRWPGVIPGGREDRNPSGQWNWLATFAEVAGVPVPAASDGVSLMPSLTGRGEQIPGTVYVEYMHTARTPNYADFTKAHRNRTRGQMQNILLGGYMGVRYDVKSADDDFEIYNVEKDPAQAHDLAKKTELASLQTAMKERVLQVRKPSRGAPRPYDKALVPPVNSTPDGAPGFTWSLFEGEWPWLPDFNSLPPVKRGKTKTIDLTMAPAGQPFGVAFESHFHATQDGEYTFKLNSDTGAMLFLHDIRVIDEPLKKLAGSFSGKLRLKAGWHPMRIYYRHAGSEKPRLELNCLHGGATEYKLSPEIFRTATANQ